MKVKELIAILSKLPKTYEVTVLLEPMPARWMEGFVDPNQKPEAMSAFISTAFANKETKSVFIVGCAIPKDETTSQHGNN